MKRSKFISGKGKIELPWPTAEGERWVQKEDSSHVVIIEGLGGDGDFYMIRSNKFGNSTMLKSDLVIHYKLSERAHRYSIGQRLIKKHEYRQGMEVVPVLEIYGRSDGGRTMWQVRDGSEEPNEYLLTNEDLDKYYEPI